MKFASEVISRKFISTVFAYTNTQIQRTTEFQAVLVNGNYTMCTVNGVAVVLQESYCRAL